MDPALEEKLNKVFDEWSADDASNAESADDTTALKDPAQWMESDAAQRAKTDAAGGLAREGAQSLRLRQPTAMPPVDEPRTPPGNAPVPGVAPNTRLGGATPGAVQSSPAGGAPDWQQLAERLRSAEMGAQQNRDAEHLFANVAPGYKERTDYGGNVALAKQPLELAQARQQFEHGDLANKTAKAGIAAKAAEQDPNSLQSQKARESIRAFFGDAVKLPAGFDNWSAADVKAFASSPAAELARIKGTQDTANAKAHEAEAAKQAGLSDRKKLMLKLYPEHAPEIDSLTDLGAAQALQTALEGRAGREDTQTHADEAAKKASERALSNQIAAKEWEQTHKSPTAEQSTQLEALEKAQGTIDEFEKALGQVNSVEEKLAASHPNVGGMIGAKGSAFPSARKLAETQLARGLEGGTAKPGNVEMIDQMLPTHLDTAKVRAEKLAQLRAQMKANEEAFHRAAQQSGTKLQPIAARPAPAPTQDTPAIPERPAGVPETARYIKGKWYYPKDNGKWQVVETPR